MNSNEKYNMMVSEISKSKSDKVYPKTFNLDFQEFKSIIYEIEDDGLFEKGFWALGDFYIFNGLTFKGRTFLENNDKKEYHKIEKKEITYNNVNVGGDNFGNIVTGNNNTFNNEFNKKFDELIKAIEDSNLQNKDLIIQELNNKKDDTKTFKDYLVSLLGIGLEASISTLIGYFLKS